MWDTESCSKTFSGLGVNQDIPDLKERCWDWEIAAAAEISDNLKIWKYLDGLDELSSGPFYVL